MSGKHPSTQKVTWVSDAYIVQPETVFASMEEAENKDLMYIGFTLCHEGANSKGDRFTIAELKKAWKTIQHKPINWEHAEPNIGVVLDSALETQARDEKNKLKAKHSPAKISCVGGIWKQRYPEFAHLITKGSNDSSLKVSMEAFFRSPDYVLGEYDEVIPEEEADEDLIRSRGTYLDGKFVSRELHNVIFGGVGITTSPADEKARIWACAFDKSDGEYHEYLHEVYEGKRMGVMKKELIVSEHELVTCRLSDKSKKEGSK